MRIALVAVAIASSFGQADGQRFTGRWSADRQDRPVVRLDLRMSRDALEGWIQLANIHVDQQGEIDSVQSDLAPTTKLLEIKVQGRSLAFARRDGADLDHFELTVIDDRTVDLRFVPSEADRRELADNGVPLPKPIRLIRATR